MSLTNSCRESSPYSSLIVPELVTKPDQLFELLRAGEWYYCVAHNNYAAIGKWDSNQRIFIGRSNVSLPIGVISWCRPLKDLHFVSNETIPVKPERLGDFQIIVIGSEPDTFYLFDANDVATIFHDSKFMYAFAPTV